MSFKGIKGNIYYLSTPDLVKGSDMVIKTQLVNKSTGEPYVINGFEGVTGFFPKDDGTAMSIVGSVASAFQGVCSFSIPASGSIDLEAGDEVSFEQHLEDEKGLTIFQFNEALIIKDGLF